MRQDTPTVRSLLRDGRDVNAAQGDGMTALHWAALHSDAELATMLLYAGANVRATTRLGGYTPLHLASQIGAPPVVRALVSRGASATAATTTGATPLMLAASSGSVDTTTILLDHGVDPNARDAANGETALMFAAALDRSEVVRLLMQHGADATIASTIVDVTGLAAPEESLQQAIRSAQAARAAGGAAPTEDPTATPRGANPAARAGDRPAVPGLSRPYTYSELVGRQGGLTALHFAARQGAQNAVRALVEGGADLNAASPADRTSALLIATINGQFDIAAYLLDHGATPNLASDGGVTPLYAVVNVQWAPRMFYPQPRAQLQQRTSYLEVMKALLDKGADPNVRTRRKVWYTQYNFDLLRVDEGGATPLWRAAYASDVDAMKLLVAYGADPSIPTMKSAGRARGGDGDREVRDVSNAPPVPVGGPGIPPLVAAAGAGYGEGFAGNAHRFSPGGMLAAVKYLVEELRADVNAKDHEGNTALHNAASRGDNEMILYLIAKGADVMAVNRAGQTTVDMANGPVQRIQPFPETIKLLEGLGAKNNHKCVSC
ncbi:MAG: ankyrin repeat domain-containing protein [Acidobacteria bacterium]|nr:ankyrin repeat domain-containing protein [Acidobacteriota bacterium]